MSSSKHLPSTSEDDHTFSNLLPINLSTLTIENNNLKSRNAKLRHRVAARDEKIEVYKKDVKGYASAIEKLKEKVSGMAEKRQDKEGSVKTGMRREYVAPTVDMGLRRDIGDMAIGVGPLQIIGGEVAAGDNGDEGGEDQNSDSATDDDDEHGGVKLEEEDASISEVGEEIDDLNIKKGEQGHCLQGNTDNVEDTGVFESTGAPEFNLVAARQNILHQLQNLPISLGGQEFIVTRPTATATNLAATELQLQLLHIIAAHDLKLRNRHLQGSIKGSTHTQEGNLAAHSGEILVDMAHFVLGNIKDKELLVKVYGQDVRRILIDFTTPGPCVMSQKEIQILNLRGSMFAELGATTLGWWSQADAARRLARFRKLEQELRALRNVIDTMHGDKVRAIGVFERNEEVAKIVKEMISIADRVRGFRAKGR
ncbi:hypothetical protein BKA65DRAFT_474185 [Rhexocercosporidium sp. MPI-PUGE-AT-0058]|nr:hypothetical protein BKA65DRAFT_474185 [Rhexocercosporidium sp. MPI-PUGE-AT-0058]